MLVFQILYSYGPDSRKWQPCPKNEVYLNKSIAQKDLKKKGYNKFVVIDGQTIYKSEKYNDNLFPNSESYAKIKELKAI